MTLPRATPAALGFGLIWAFLIVFVVFPLIRIFYDAFTNEAGQLDARQLPGVLHRLFLSALVLEIDGARRRRGVHDIGDRHRASPFSSSATISRAATSSPI